MITISQIHILLNERNWFRAKDSTHLYECTNSLIVKEVSGKGSHIDLNIVNKDLLTNPEILFDSENPLLCDTNSIVLDKEDPKQSYSDGDITLINLDFDSNMEMIIHHGILKKSITRIVEIDNGSCNDELSPIIFFTGNLLLFSTSLTGVIIQIVSGIILIITIKQIRRI